jgi:hypothetical protein
MVETPPRGEVAPAKGSEGECPACGGPLYAWVKAHPSDARSNQETLLDRCERCGLVVARSAPAHPASGGDFRAGAERELQRLFERSPNGARGELRAPNRRSVQAAIGEGSWAALELPERPLVLTPAALEALLRNTGGELERVRFPAFGRNQVWMWQTLMNALTFHPNFAREALAGRLRPRRGRDRLTFAIDVVVSVLAAPLVALCSVPLELVAALARRGGEMRATVRVERSGQESSSASSASSPAASS